MAKPSTQVLLMQAQREIARLQHELIVARTVATRFCADAAVISAHRVFHRTGDIIAEFQEDYMNTVLEIAKMADEDADTVTKDGKYLEYHWAKVDEAMLAALTEKYFIPHEIRHHMTGDPKTAEVKA